MENKLSRLPAVLTATLLTTVFASSAHANYVCTGKTGPADPSTPYFNGDLTDVSCGVAEVEAALDIAIDESLIIGSKTNNNEPLPGWTQDEFDLGTLEVTAWDSSSQTGAWELMGGITPLFWVEKYNTAYDIYTYIGDATSPFSDSWDGANHGVTGDVVCKTPGGGKPPEIEIKCGADTSHLSAYGVVPVPAAVGLFGSGVLGLIGVARGRRV